MNRSLIIASALFLIFGQVSAVIFREIDTTVPVKCTFSNTHQNRIVVEEGRVEKILFTDDFITVRMEEESGQAFICQTRPIDKSTVISVVTDKGLVQDIEIEFSKRSSEVVVLKECKAKKNSVDDRNIVAVIDKILSGQTPEGYCCVEGKREGCCIGNGIKSSVVANFESSRDIIQMVTLVNMTKEVRCINPSQLCSSNTRWVYLIKDRLSGRDITLALVSQRKENLMSQTVLKNQKKLLFLVAGGIVAAALFLFYAFNDDPHSTIAAAPEKLELPGDTINPQEIWMTRLENENKILKKQMEYFEKILLEIKQAQEEKKQTSDSAKTEIVKLKDELKRALTKPFRESREKSTAEEENRSGRSVVFTEDPFVSVPHAQQNDEQPVRMLFKEAVMGKAKRNVLHIDKAIPAGTSVKAVLISSIDAPCGIYSRTEPQPIKLRILDNGHLPKEVEAKLKGGLIIASAYGDISTERVYMRIERMSKVESNGEFVETSVTGFISGEDGKFGVRGTVIDKSEKIVANAARSGFLGGIGSILQSAVGKHDVNQFSLDIIRQGCAGGASNAFDMLADYYIKRAEQVVPVIQVTAGRIVDITFTHQTELGDLHTKYKVKEIREQSRRIEQ